MAVALAKSGSSAIQGPGSTPTGTLSYTPLTIGNQILLIVQVDGVGSVGSVSNTPNALTWSLIETVNYVNGTNSARVALYQSSQISSTSATTISATIASGNNTYLMLAAAEVSGASLSPWTNVVGLTNAFNSVVMPSLTPGAGDLAIYGGGGTDYITGGSYTGWTENLFGLSGSNHYGVWGSQSPAGATTGPTVQINNNSSTVVVAGVSIPVPGPSSGFLDLL